MTLLHEPVLFELTVHVLPEGERVRVKTYYSRDMLLATPEERMDIVRGLLTAVQDVARDLGIAINGGG